MVIDISTSKNLHALEFIFSVPKLFILLFDLNSKFSCWNHYQHDRFSLSFPRFEIANLSVLFNNRQSVSKCFSRTCFIPPDQILASINHFKSFVLNWEKISDSTFGKLFNSLLTYVIILRVGNILIHFLFLRLRFELFALLIVNFNFLSLINQGLLLNHNLFISVSKSKHFFIYLL